jgi:hypothetical protein
MARESIDTPRTVSLEIKVRIADAVEEQPSAAVYAFARSGQLIDRITADAGGRARLHLPDLRVMQEVRVMVGPHAQDEQATVAELSRRGAREQFVRISPTIEPPTLEFEIQPQLHSSWSRHCLVRGTLHKRSLDGSAAPIGNATVQIWEIEPVELMIAKLPDAVVNDFRELILEAAGRRDDPARSQRMSVRAARVQSAKPLVAEQMRALASSSQFAALLARADGAAADLRHHLEGNAAAVRLLLCLLYPAWIRKHMLGNATTDADGRFQALVFPSSHCPGVNLYFTASVVYRGASVPVYDPKPVARFTHWDYETGTEVELAATNEPSGALTESPAHDAARAAARVIAAGSA